MRCLAPWPHPWLHPNMALAPSWSGADFQATVFAWAAQLRQAKIEHAAVWFEDAALMAAALLACNFARVQAWLPGQLTPANRVAVDEQVGVWLSDSLMADVHRPCWLWDIDAASVARTLAADSGSTIDGAVVLVLQTSGSTGAPKWVSKPWSAMLAEAAALAALPWPQTVSALWGSVSPQHLYGLTFRIFMPLIQGWPIWRTTVRYPEDAAQLSASYPATLGVVSPTWLRAWAAHAQDKRGMRQTQFICAGGMLLPDLAQAVSDAGLPAVQEIYGSTETGVLAWRRRHQHQAWQFLTGVDAHIDEMGQLSAQSEWSGGRQATGDVIQCDGAFFDLVGRCDRIVKVADKRVSLAQIEQQLMTQAEVADVVCAPHPNYPRLGAWVALNEVGVAAYREHGRKALVAKLKHDLGRHIDRVAIPRYWRFTTQLPRNAQGKLSSEALTVLWQPRPKNMCWTQQACEGHTWTLQSVVPLDLIYFSGHFDAFPLVPGVVELQWVIDAWQAETGQTVQVQGVENLKYQHFLRPADEVVLTLQWLPEKNKLRFQLHTPEAVCASGRVVLCERPKP